ncbi:MAG: hypothetical protein A4E53_01708 [Pelotomaculum sp. PtaB.Bin104]|nr:MAG: hypothetical protein A4E53_01708 [Pelotomaculum sp. PtaB.Bin104]
MKVIVKKNYGSSQIELEIEAQDVKEALFKGAIFTIKDQCNLCNSTDISLDGNKTEEGHTYLKRRCGKCGATSTLGTYKTGGAYFWKKFEKYQTKQEGAPPPEKSNYDTDLPF